MASEENGSASILPRRKWTSDADIAPRDARLSVWTIIGSIAASVIATAIIGGAAGLLQVPTLGRDVEGIKGVLESNRQIMATLSERMRSAELVTDAINRRLVELAAEARALDARRELIADSLAKFREYYVNEHAALEGRSKDRHTDAMGAANALKVSDAAIRDQMSLLAVGQQQMRSQMLDIVSRLASRGATPQQFVPPPDGMIPPLLKPQSDIPNDTWQRRKEQMTRWEHAYNE